MKADELKQQMIQDIISVNNVLEPVVKKMGWKEKLCNCHPRHRAVYVSRLKAIGIFSNEEAEQYVS